MNAMMDKQNDMINQFLQLGATASFWRADPTWARVTLTVICHLHMMYVYRCSKLNACPIQIGSLSLILVYAIARCHAYIPQLRCEHSMRMQLHDSGYHHMLVLCGDGKHDIHTGTMACDQASSSHTSTILFI